MKDIQKDSKPVPLQLHMLYFIFCYVTRDCKIHKANT